MTLLRLPRSTLCSYPQADLAEATPEKALSPTHHRHSAASTTSISHLEIMMGKLLLEEISPVVMVLSTQLAEQYCTKRRLNFVEMLSPFSVFSKIDESQKSSGAVTNSGGKATYQKNYGKGEARKE
ncbi:uncharacterized protein LOC120282402 [Dioscorea cayenensis subsp. rotundata]|uniref:Uncharacterized protein LOC120282402 n=1 Tax=Dioscorea cayennensis subsp. rotundata TaxID=55577 RepID=A0AB40CYP7_DIOCR|nr:uncharacterized protein LOC120282402 [Dioscorea cayenensis subsp. rotundata]